MEQRSIMIPVSALGVLLVVAVAASGLLCVAGMLIGLAAALAWP